MRRLFLLLAIAACGGDDSPVQQDAAMQEIDAQQINMTTSLAAMFMANRTLDNAGYGVNTNDGTLHVEVHKGGFTGCPQMNSPTPDYTLIIPRVAAMSAPTATSTASFLDYKGDMLTGIAPVSATSVMLTNVSYSAGAFLKFDVQLTFAEGTITGHLYAQHCTSLDG